MCFEKKFHTVHVHRERHVILILESECTLVEGHTTNRTTYKRLQQFDDFHPLQVFGPYRNHLTSRSDTLSLHRLATLLWLNR